MRLRDWWFSLIVAVAIVAVGAGASERSAVRDSVRGFIPHRAIGCSSVDDGSAASWSPSRRTCQVAKGSDSRVILDPTFGDGGVVEASFHSGLSDSEATAVAIQADGRVLVAGRLDSFSGMGPTFVLARFNPDGSLDTTYGDGGRLMTVFPGSACYDYPTICGATDIALAGDGGAVVVGNDYTEEYGSDSRLALARYRPDGSLDPGFGVDGVVTDTLDWSYIGSGDPPLAAAIQSDGRIVLLVDMAAFALVRYEPDGRRDTSFGVNGFRFISGRPSEDGDILGYDLATQPDGRILVAGRLGEDIGDIDFAVARYDSTGGIDKTFGEGGFSVLDVGGGTTDVALAMELTPDGQILVAGGSDGQGVVARLNADGSVDTSFAQDGILLLEMDGIHWLQLLPRGQFLVADDTTIRRLSLEGVLDTSFGDDGSARAMTHLRAIDMAAHPDGGVVTVGSSADQFTVARLASDGARDLRFGLGGGAMVRFRGGYSSDRVSGLALLPDGGLMVAGDSRPHEGRDTGMLAAARYTANGHPDNTYTFDGLDLLDPFNGSDVWVRYVVAAAAPDGALVVAGEGAGGVVLVRVLPSGDVDRAFGQQGVAHVPGEDVPITDVTMLPDGGVVLAAADRGMAKLSDEGQLAWVLDHDDLRGSGMDEVLRATAQPDGRIVVCGRDRDNSVGVVARFLPDGTIDEAFGSGGRAAVGGGCGALAIDQAGRIVKAGSEMIQEREGSRIVYRSVDFVVTRLLPTGQLDETFGDEGYVVTGFTFDSRPRDALDHPIDTAYDVLIDDRGSIVVAGISSDQGIVLSRYDDQGRLDLGFDGDGRVLIPAWDVAYAEEQSSSFARRFTLTLAEQPGGRLVIATTSNRGVLDRFATYGLAEYESSILAPFAGR